MDKMKAPTLCLPYEKLLILDVSMDIIVCYVGPIVFSLSIRDSVIKSVNYYLDMFMVHFCFYL